MRLLVCGPRDLKDRDAVWATLDREHAESPITLLIHGDCETGADSFAAQWAGRLGIPLDPHPVRWSDVTVPGAMVKYDRRGRAYNAAAGPMRNTEMLDTLPDKVLAFVHKDRWQGTPGTSDMLGKARAAKSAGRLKDIAVVPV